jgi:hypothetical protein
VKLKKGKNRKAIVSCPIKRAMGADRKNNKQGI